MTRNAVIGKVHRLKLSGRAKPASSAPRAARAAAAARRAAVGSTRPAAAAIGSMMKSRTMGSAPMHGATALKIAEDLAAELYVAARRCRSCSFRSSSG